MHKEEKRKPSLEHENKQFMTPIQLVIILLERQALLLLYSIFLGQSKDIKEKTSLDNFLVFVFHRILVMSIGAKSKRQFTQSVYADSMPFYLSL